MKRGAQTRRSGFMLNPRHFQQFLKFIVVGGIATLINYAIFYGLLNYLHINYQVSFVAGFLAGVAAGYPLNKLWTYKNKENTSLKIGTSYLAVYICSLCIGLAALHMLVIFLGFDPRLANLLVIGVTTCINFIGTKFLVFRT